MCVIMVYILRGLLLGGFLQTQLIGDLRQQTLETVHGLVDLEVLVLGLHNTTTHTKTTLNCLTKV